MLPSSSECDERLKVLSEMKEALLKEYDSLGDRIHDLEREEKIFRKIKNLHDGVVEDD